MKTARYMTVVLLGLALWAVPITGAGAEELSALEEGALIKVTVTTVHEGKSRSETIKGTLVEWGKTFITLIPETSIVPVTIDRKLVTRLEVMVRPSKRGKGAMIGLGVGAVTGALLGASGGDDPSGIVSYSAGAKAVMGGLTLGLVGALIGAIVGPGEKWDDVPTNDLSLTLGSMPSGETGFFISRRF